MLQHFMPGNVFVFMKEIKAPEIGPKLKFRDIRETGPRPHKMTGVGFVLWVVLSNGCVVESFF